MKADTYLKEKTRCFSCQYLRAGLRLAYGLVARIYIFIFARPSMQTINNVVLQLALQGCGYNNCCDSQKTGEAFFIDLLAKTGPKLCIDVGANIGDYSETLLSKTKSHVIAFEPLPKAFDELLKLKTSYPNRFDALNVGVGIEETSLELFYGASDSVLASFCKEINEIEAIGENNVNAMTVSVIKLDSYYEKYIKGKFDSLDLLKIDTEGFEYEVLIGAQQTIRDLKPNFIQIEYNWHQLFRNQSLKKLSELMPGYTAYQMLPYGGGLIRRDLNRPETNIFYYSNFIFARDDSNWAT